MGGIEEILRAYKGALQQGCELALATVVNVQGSAYRGIGARMLITSDGQSIGSVSGGCLETDVRRHAQWVMQTRTPKRLVYESRGADDEDRDPFQLGCEGAVEVLVEPLGAHDPQMQFLEACLAGRSAGLVATVFSSEPPDERLLGARLFWRESAQPAFARLEPRALRAALLAEAPQVWAQRKRALRVFQMDGQSVHVCFEVVRPPQALWIFGGGYDAIALVDLAVRLGFRVTVVDSRPGYAVRSRFPQAAELLNAVPSVAIEQLADPAGSAVVIMNHSYSMDLAALRAALRKAPGYLGLLGPAVRAARLLGEAAADGSTPADREPAALYSPVGLDVGAETPEEVALAILAEVKAAFSGRTGGSLRRRGARIHAPTDTKIVSVAVGADLG